MAVLNAWTIFQHCLLLKYNLNLLFMWKINFRLKKNILIILYNILIFILIMTIKRTIHHSYRKYNLYITTYWIKNSVKCYFHSLK